jgi:DnaJ-class molecular chaperone
MRLIDIDDLAQDSTAFFAQYLRPRCTVCEGAPEATDTEPACRHCRGSGHEPGERT